MTTSETTAFLVKDSEDIPVREAEEVDSSAVNPSAPYVGDSSRTRRPKKRRTGGKR